MIKIDSLNKIFNQNKPNQFHALKNINLTINKNEIVVLKGISGSGKSTLLSIIASFIKPTNGFLKVNNEQIAKLSDLHISNFRLHNIGFIFQSFNLFEDFTAYENLLTSLIPLGILNDKCESKINEALKLINIYHKKDI